MKHLEMLSIALFGNEAIGYAANCKNTSVSLNQFITYCSTYYAHTFYIVGSATYAMWKHSMCAEHRAVLTRHSQCEYFSQWILSVSALGILLTSGFLQGA